MILVTLGTQDKQFKRLLVQIEKLIDEKVIDTEVIVQQGYTKYSSGKMKLFDYIPMDEFENLIDKADVIITHGGVGTIMQALKRNKKIIGVARLEEYNEHQNNHQIQILEEFDEKGYLIYAKDLENLEEYYKKVLNFNPKSFVSNTNNMINLISDFIG